MIKCIKTNSKHQDFINLVKALDEDLAIRDGAEHNPRLGSCPTKQQNK